MSDGGWSIIQTSTSTALLNRACLGNKDSSLGLAIELRKKLIGGSVLHNQALAVLHAQRLLTFCSALGAEITLVCGDGNKIVLEYVRGNFPRTNLLELDAKTVDG